MKSKHDERDRYIVEWFGECWHKTKQNPKSITQVICIKCKKVFKFSDRGNMYRDLSTPDGFFWLWPKMRKDEMLWEKFLHWLYLQCSFPVRQIEFLINYIEPANFADAVEEFLKSLGVKSFNEWKEKD